MSQISQNSTNVEKLKFLEEAFDIEAIRHILQIKMSNIRKIPNKAPPLMIPLIYPIFYDSKSVPTGTLLSYF